MTAFGYTILGFGSGVVGGTPEAIPAGSAVKYLGDSVPDDINNLLFDDDDPNKCVMVYRDNSTNRAMAVVGSIDGTTITMGTPAQASAVEKSTYYVSSCGIEDGKFLVTYQRSDSHYLFCRIGTVSGTSISFGTEQGVNSYYMYWSESGWDFRGEAKVAICWRDSTTGAADNDHRVICGTVSGTTVSFGSAVVMNDSIYSIFQTLEWDPNTDDTFTITWSHNGINSYGKVCTVSGTTVTAGTDVTLGSGFVPSNWSNGMAYDPFTANKLVVVYDDINGTDEGKCRIGTVSAPRGLAWGSEIVFNDSDTSASVISFDPTNQNSLVVVYESYDGDDYVGVRTGTLDLAGDSITFGDEIKLNDANPNKSLRVRFVPSAWEQSGKFLVLYTDGDDSDYGKAVVCQMAVA